MYRENSGAIFEIAILVKPAKLSLTVLINDRYVIPLEGLFSGDNVNAHHLDRARALI